MSSNIIVSTSLLHYENLCLLNVIAAEFSDVSRVKFKAKKLNLFMMGTYMLLWILDLYFDRKASLNHTKFLQLSFVNMIVGKKRPFLWCSLTLAMAPKYT